MFSRGRLWLFSHGRCCFAFSAALGRGAALGRTDAIVFVFLVGTGIKTGSAQIGLLCGASGTGTWSTRVGLRLLLNRLYCRSGIVAVLLASNGLHHDRLGRHGSRHDRTVVVGVVVVIVAVVCVGDTGLGELCLRNGGHCRRIGRSDGSGLHAWLIAMDTDHGGTTGERRLLGRDRVNDGVGAVGGSGHTAAQAGGDTRGATAAIVGHVGKRGVAQVAWHEEVLVGSGARKRWNGGYERGWSVRRGPVGDTRNVGDLNDIRGTGQDGRCDGAVGFSGLLGVCSSLLLAVVSTSAQTVLIALLADKEPPDESDDDGNKGDTTDDSTGNSARTTASTRGIILRARAASGRSFDTFCGSALVAGLTDHGTGRTLFAGGT